MSDEPQDRPASEEGGEVAWDGHPTLTAAVRPEDWPESPLPVLKGLVALRRAVSLYPAGHTMIGQVVGELLGELASRLEATDELRLDVIDGAAHLDGYAFRMESQAHAAVLAELAGLGIDSVWVQRGVTREELRELGELLAELPEGGSNGPPLREELERRGVRHVSLGRIVVLDTRWRRFDWPDAPDRILDPAYGESLVRAEDTLGAAREGRLDEQGLRDLVGLLTVQVASSGPALSQILAVKQYENHTYCHSVNVAILSLLLGRRLGMEEEALSRLSEAALLHDLGKLEVPVEVLKKPGPLDARERRLIEGHPRSGAQILAGIDGLSHLTPTVALEHHRGVDGSGYPDLGAEEPVHPMSQVVAVADIYEALTGARSYREPALPEQACLILAQMAGEKLNPALVKAFVSTISFFPVGSLVRTDRGEVGVVVATAEEEPLHPVISLVDGAGGTAREGERLDTAARGPDGEYLRHVVETLRPPRELELERHVRSDEAEVTASA